MNRDVRLTPIETELAERTARENPEEIVPVIEAILMNRRFHRLHPVVAERRLQRDEQLRTSPPGDPAPPPPQG